MSPRKKGQRRVKKEESDLLIHFAAYIKQRRLRNDLTLRQFALRTRIPYSNIFQMEEVAKNPRLTELEQLAHGFNESLYDFLLPLLKQAGTRPPVPYVTDANSPNRWTLV